MTREEAKLAHHADELRSMVAARRLTEAIALLHRAYSSRIATYLRRHLRYYPDGAADAEQETWQAAQKALPKYRFDADVLVWLLSIARNKMLDCLRRLRRQRHLDSGELSSRVPASSTPSSKFRREETRRRVRHLIESLPPQEQELLDLFFVEELSSIQAAEVLGIRADTARKRLDRLLDRLRARIESEDSA